VASTPDLYPLLEAALSSIGSPFVAHSPQPASVDHVLDTFARIGLTPPPSLVEWYRWRNGDGEPDGDFARASCYLIGAFACHTVEESASRYLSLRDDLGDLDYIPYEHGWFPLLQSQHFSRVLCVDCVASPGSVVMYDTHDDSPKSSDERRFATVEELVNFYVTIIESGWITSSPTSPIGLQIQPSSMPRDMQPLARGL
jgi:hypothetical protein